MKNMTARQLIEKFRLEKFGNSQAKLVKALHKPTAKQMEELKSRKDEIWEELGKIEVERKERLAAQKAAEEAAEEQYLATADLRRCLVIRTDEYLQTTVSIRTLEYKDGRFYRMEYGDNGYVEVSLTATVENLQSTIESTPYGWEAGAREITPEQEAQIIAEHKGLKAQADAEKKAQDEAKEKAQAQRKAEIAEKFAEAKRTGQRVLLGETTTQCNRRDIECSVDIVRHWAMPDGTERTERIHTC